jgi:hypothetical protein
LDETARVRGSPIFLQSFHQVRFIKSGNMQIIRLTDASRAIIAVGSTYPRRKNCGVCVSGTASKTRVKSRVDSMMAALLSLWGGLTLVLVVLLIYRGTLTMHEDDQLFLDNAEDHMQKEQEELLKKMDRITPWVRVLGTCSAVLIFVIGGISLYTNLTR